MHIENFSVRLEEYQLEALSSLGIPYNKIIRELIDKYIIERKNDLPDFIKEKIIEVEQHKARQITKTKISDLMHLNNAKNLIRKLYKQGINFDMLDSFLISLTKEAVTKGYDPVDFLNEIKEDLRKWDFWKK